MDRSARFWSKVEKAGADDCWLWIGARSSDGYGSFGIGGAKTIGAHRFAFISEHGAVPPGLSVLHSCDNPACVNPRHLRAGTQKENVNDRDSRQRRIALRGERHPNAKLTEAAVVEIRRRRDDGEVFRTIAADFGISIANVHLLCSRAAWRHAKGA